MIRCWRRQEITMGIKGDTFHTGTVPSGVQNRPSTGSYRLRGTPAGPTMAGVNQGGDQVNGTSPEAGHGELQWQAFLTRLAASGDSCATSGPSGLCRWQRRVYGARVPVCVTHARPLDRCVDGRR